MYVLKGSFSLLSFFSNPSVLLYLVIISRLGFWEGYAYH